MNQAPIDELMKRCGSIYKLVVIAARRAKELSEGSPKFVSTELKKVTSVALEEIRQGKVLYQPEGEEEPKGERKTKERAKGKEAASAKPAQAVAAAKKRRA